MGADVKRTIAPIQRMRYTRFVKATKQWPIFPMIRYFALVLIGLSVLGCASVWLTPTPPLAGFTTPTSPLHAFSEHGPKEVGVIPSPEWAAESPSRPLSSLITVTVTDEALQYWVDPNDITGLLYDDPYLWAATGGGVVRWHLPSDEWQVYTTRGGLASHAIRGIAQDQEGHIWVGYADHPSWSEYDGEKWHTYASREAAVAARYDAMRAARRFDVRLWVCRPSGAWLWLPKADGRVQAYDGKTWRTYGESEGVTRGTWLVVVSNGGRVWAVGQGVSTAEERERWWQDHSLFSGMGEDGEITGIAVDKQGRLWLTFVGPQRMAGGTANLDFLQSRWTSYQNFLESAIPKQVYGIEIDREDTVWLWGEGVISFRRLGGRWQTIAVPGITARNLARDREGRLWIGTNHGIYSVTATGKDLRGPRLLPTPLMGNSVNSLAMDLRGALYIGTTQGVSRIAASGHTSVITAEKATLLAVDPSGQVWMGTTSGLYTLSDAGPERRVLNDIPSAMAFDRQGVPWICTEDGRIGKLRGSSWQVMSSTVALSGVAIRDIIFGMDDVLWLATSNGVATLSPTGEVALVPPKEGLPPQNVRALAVGTDGSLWVGAANGLVRRTSSGDWALYTTTSTEGGLRSMEIWDLAVDGKGTLWIATSAGISARTKDADWSYFDLPGVRKIWPEPSGVVWVGTLGGLYRLKPEVFTRISGR